MANALKPPSTTATVPVTKLLASLMRYWMVPHSSSALPKTFERSLANHIITTLSICTIFVCQQSTVLFGQEESRSNGIHADAFTNFVATSLAMNAVKLEIPAFAAA